MYDKILWEFPQIHSRSMLFCVTYGVGMLWFCLFWSLLKRSFSELASLERWWVVGRGQSLFLVMKSLPVQGCVQSPVVCVSLPLP